MAAVGAAAPQAAGSEKAAAAEPAKPLTKDAIRELVARLGEADVRPETWNRGPQAPLRVAGRARWR
jgi:hypothetical protein